MKVKVGGRGEGEGEDAPVFSFHATGLPIQAVHSSPVNVSFASRFASVPSGFNDEAV